MTNIEARRASLSKRPERPPATRAAKADRKPILNTERLATLRLRSTAVTWRRGVAGAVLATAASIVGCDANPVKSPSDEATERVRTRCASNGDETAIAPVLDGSAIESVEPLYNQGEGGARIGHWSVLAGTAITVRAIPGVTAEWLTRALECHSARRVMGSIPSSATPNDPFWLPGRMIDIEAQSAHGAFRIEVRGAGPAEGRQVLDRARAFTRTASPTAAL
jgi:hypothetical protein